MLRIHYLHWNADEAAERAARLQELGLAVNWELPGAGGLTAFLKALEAEKPAVLVIDLGRLPSQGRDIGLNVRRRQGTRHIPLLFAGGKPEKVAAVRKVLPDAAFSSWDELADTIHQTASAPPEDPLDPGSVFAPYAGKPLADKLGIKPGMAVAVVNKFRGFERLLEPLPDEARLVDGPADEAGLTIWFLPSRAEMEASLPQMVVSAGQGPLWLAWPKKASGVKSDLTQNVVRELGLAAGLVDYKITSVNQTWSALAFTVRK